MLLWGDGGFSVGAAKLPGFTFSPDELILNATTGPDARGDGTRRFQPFTMLTPKKSEYENYQRGY